MFDGNSLEHSFLDFSFLCCAYGGFSGLFGFCGRKLFELNAFSVEGQKFCGGFFGFVVERWHLVWFGN